MPDYKPIETEYNGYRFRSRLEARWAVFFDQLGIKYEYEPEGFELSDGTWYLPDFYLTESNSFFEVKGIMSDKDSHKIEQLIKDTLKVVTIGYSDMSFQTCDKWYEDTAPTLTQKEYSILGRCAACGEYYFVGEIGVWTCQCCGYYSGDSTYYEQCRGDWTSKNRFWSPEKHIEDAFKTAKSSRFEYGEAWAKRNNTK